MKQPVVYTYPYAVVKQRAPDIFDVWSWNVYKLKWTRMNNHGCGYGSLKGAAMTASRVSNETAAMLAANREPPEPCK